MVCCRNRSWNDGTAIDDQDDDRDQRPRHFEQRVVGGLGRDRIGARVEAHDHDHQQDEHEQRDRGDQIEQEVVEPDDVVHHRRSRTAASPSCQGEGCPTAASAACRPAAKHDRSRQRPANRLSIRIVVFAPSAKSSDASEPHRPALIQVNARCRKAPAGGRAPRQAVRREGDSRSLSNHNSGALAMCLGGCRMRQSVCTGRMSAFRPGIAQTVRS